jgi:hypothetical protein
MSFATICHGCGQSVDIDDDYARAKIRCPECGVMCEVPAPEARKSAAKKPSARAGATAPPTSADNTAKPSPEPRKPTPKNRATPAAPPMPTPPPAPALNADEDDGKPYQVSGGDQRKCPDCNKVLEPEAVVCDRCGFDLQTGKKPAKTYAKVERHWEAGWPFHKRLVIFIAAQVVVVSLGMIAVVAEGAWVGFISAWLLFTGLTAFLLGTSDRIDLTRSKRGQVKLSKTYRVFFFLRPPKTYKLAEFEGVVTGRANDVDITDWVIAWLLLPFGLIPAILWWWYFIHNDQFFAALSKDHGFPSDILYQGLSQDHAEDIAKTIRDVAGLVHNLN